MKIFKYDDPSNYYNHLYKIGSGLFANVFKVMSKENNKCYAMKQMNPKTQDE
jgi:hypothetical protein